LRLARSTRRPHTEARREALWALAFLSPYLIIFIVWQIFPMFYGVWLSFTNLDLLNASEVQFVGLSNFLKVFSDPFVVLSLKNTLYFTVGSVGLGIVLALALASAMNNKSFAASWVKWVCFIPYLMGPSAIAIVWKRIFLGYSGPLNHLLIAVGLQNVAWLNNTISAMPAVIIVSVWTMLGFNSLILLSGIQNISVEVKEAAMIDGAGPWEIFWSITMPLLKPILFFVITFAFIGAFQAFGLVYALTTSWNAVYGGDPLYHTLTFVMYIYAVAFKNMQVGYGAALSLVLMAIILGITMIERRLLGGEE
jgi:multiple sugar transport system permease protein